ncbi:MAG: hypothetical protein K9N46_10350 [Candidatus Marinimicrobia bacterium]|nr:hypothetical protein [Candidatus Neomarinimicrobiota bacterium]MCF7829221.1 hypothetical protein [Candidatus Neomarinimicrobiota bacterium]MCF7881126.1 hypothetical protein [Candidatus Neomarinimicrobiota bacterium]
MRLNKQLRWGILVMLLVPVLLFGLLYWGMQSSYTNDIQTLAEQKAELQQKVDSLRNVVTKVEDDINTVSKVNISRIVATAYNSFTWQTNDDPFTTSSGEQVQDGTLALSRDLIQAESDLMHRMGFNPTGAYAYGDTVFVVYVKPMVVHDTMNKRFQHRADIWLEDYGTAREWGKRKVFIARRSDS